MKDERGGGGEATGRRTRRDRRGSRSLLDSAFSLHPSAFILFLFLPLLLALDAFLVEPWLLLVESRAPVPLDMPLRIVHLSDLHVRRDGWRMGRLTAAVAGADPDLILVSGDLVHDPRGRADALGAARQAAGVVRRLAAIAPVLAVQGHSDYEGPVVAELAAAGVEWLSNEGRRVGPRGRVLLLGVNQQVGWDDRRPPPRFGTVETGEGAAAGYLRAGLQANAYLSWDPAPASLTDGGGPLAWSGYDVRCEVRIDDPDTAAGIAAHARYVLGEDRLIRLARGPARRGDDGSFEITLNGTRATHGELDTGVVPLPGRWYRLRLATRVADDRLWVGARVWRAGTPEPSRWQAAIEDASPRRVVAGTVALWGWGEGRALYRDLRAMTADGRVLLAERFDAGELPPGWRDGARASRLALALARSPAGPPSAATVLLTHSPDVAREALARGVDLVLAGHTHGGQVRVPGWGAPFTRSALGHRFDRGLFWIPRLAAGTWLYVNPGVGTSIMPVRFWSPPGWTVIDLAPHPRSDARRRSRSDP